MAALPLMVALLRLELSHQRQWNGCVVAQPASLQQQQQQYVQTPASSSASKTAAAQTNVGVVLLPG